MFSCYYRNQTSIGSWLSGIKDISKGHMLQFQPPPWWTILIQLSAWEDLSYETRWGSLKSLWGSTFPEEILSSNFQAIFQVLYASLRGYITTTQLPPQHPPRRKWTGSCRQAGKTWIFQLAAKSHVDGWMVGIVQSPRWFKAYKNWVVSIVSRIKMNPISGPNMNIMWITNLQINAD